MSRILVAGCRRGIGYDTALLLARAGHEVVATMRNPGACDLAKVASEQGLPLSVEALDVDVDASVAAVFGAHADSIDVLVNNAGIYSINAVEDESFSESLAQEVAGHGIRIALVEPGIIDTAMATTSLPQYSPNTIYPHGRRVHAFFRNPDKPQAPADLVSRKILEVIEGDGTRLRHPVGPDMLPLLGWRLSHSDEGWIRIGSLASDADYNRAVLTDAGVDLHLA